MVYSEHSEIYAEDEMNHVSHDKYQRTFEILKIDA